jgi:solute carrier family 25 iron transporter 28/37
MYKNEGFKSFYRSFPINYLMNVPFGSIIILINEKLKHLMKVSQGPDSANYLNYYLCGGIAGALASIPNCPFYVIKTKLNTQTCLNNLCEKKKMCDSLSKKANDMLNFEEKNN